MYRLKFTHFIFTRKIILLNWWLNRFWLGLWNTRNLPRQFPHVFLANHSKFKFSNILTFRLSNTRQYFAGDEKIGKYSISCTEHKVEKKIWKSHPWVFYLLFKEPLKVRNVNKLALKCCVWGWKALFKVFVAFVWLWKCEKMSFFSLLGATLLFNNVTWTLTSHSRRAALGGVGRQAGPSEHEEIFLQNIGKINQNNVLQIQNFKTIFSAILF